MRTRRGVCAAGAMVLAGSLLAAEPAAAVEKWTPTETLTSPGVIARSPQLLAAADGTLTAAWTGTDGDIFNPHGLVTRTKPAGGTWSPEQVVDPDATRGLQIALDGDDRIVASYRGPRESSAYAITQAGDGSFGDPVALAPNLGGHIREFDAGPFLAVGDRGQQAVVWIHQIPGQGARVVAVRRDNTDAAWSPPRFLTPANGKPRALAVDAAPGGSVAVLWTVAPRPMRLRFRLLTAGGEWTPPEPAARPADFASDLQLANRGGGRATALWTDSDDNLNHHAYSVSRTKAGNWTRIMRIGLRAHRDEKWQTLTTNGQVTVVVWSSLPRVGDSRVIARVQNGRIWGHPTALSRPGFRMWLNGAAFGADGSLRVAWFQNDGAVLTRIREPDGTWGPRSRIGHSELGDYPPSVATYGDRRAGLVSSAAAGGVLFTERTN